MKLKDKVVTGVAIQELVFWRSLSWRQEGIASIALLFQNSGCSDQLVVAKNGSEILWNHPEGFPLKQRMSTPACVLIRLLQDYISNLAEALKTEESEDFLLECVGILGNLTISDLDYELLLREFDLVPWIKTKLQPGEFQLLVDSSPPLPPLQQMLNFG